MKRLALMAALIVVMAGCATGITRMKGESAAVRYEPYLGAPIDQFTAFHFNGWESAGRNQVVVWTGVNEAYLLTVWGTCTDLNYAHRIGITSTGNTVNRLESLRVGRERCPIEEIRPIDVAGYKADRAAAREQATRQS